MFATRPKVYGMPKIADRARKARKTLAKMEAEGAVVLKKDGYGRLGAVMRTPLLLL